MQDIHIEKLTENYPDRHFTELKDVTQIKTIVNFQYDEGIDKPLEHLEGVPYVQFAMEEAFAGGKDKAVICHEELMATVSASLNRSGRLAPTTDPQFVYELIDESYDDEAHASQRLFSTLPKAIAFVFATGTPPGEDPDTFCRLTIRRRKIDAGYQGVLVANFEFDLTLGGWNLRCDETVVTFVGDDGKNHHVRMSELLSNLNSEVKDGNYYNEDTWQKGWAVRGPKIMPDMVIKR